jgi:hypothetical protein
MTAKKPIKMPKKLLAKWLAALRSWKDSDMKEARRRKLRDTLINIGIDDSRLDACIDAVAEMFDEHVELVRDRYERIITAEDGKEIIEGVLRTDADALLAQKDARIAELTGETFSDRNHGALQDRARRAEARIAELHSLLRDLRLCVLAGDMCCGFPQGGGMDENGNGEPPQCCGQPINPQDEIDKALESAP